MDNPTHKVTVILPLRNEAESIAVNMRSLVAQDYSHALMEIILVDGMSQDDTIKVALEELNNASFLDVLVIQNPARIVPTGLNLALRVAKGDVIIRVDGHTVIAPDYISQCVQCLNRTNADNVGGRMNAVGDTRFGNTVALATSSPFGIGNARFHYSQKEEWVDTVYMGAWPSTVFDKNGLFDEELVRDQDDEFNYRLRESGGKVLLSPTIKSHYTVRSSPKALAKQYFQYGFWKVRVLQKHPRQMSLRQFVPPLFVLALLLSVILALALSGGWLVLAGLLAIYLFANILASIFTGRGQPLSVTASLPLAFTILHVSYGLGFLIGLLKFANRWGDKLGKVPPWPL